MVRSAGVPDTVADAAVTEVAEEAFAADVVAAGDAAGKLAELKAERAAPNLLNITKYKIADEDVDQSSSWFASS